MNTKFLFVFLFSFFIQLSFAQQPKLLMGKVKGSSGNLENIYIQNISLKKNSKTSNGGYFSIEARPSDTLTFSSIHYNGVLYVVKPTDFDQDLVFITLEEGNAYILDEVIINDAKHKDAYEMGILDKPAKIYTKEERRLYTSRNGVDGLFNAINGKTKSLKKMQEYALEDSNINKVHAMYTDERIISEFHIPEIYVDGFVMYAAADKYLMLNIKNKNRNMCDFMMADIAQKYLKMINSKN
ncbi:MAG: hypothetical protein KBS98_07230 [Flavobacterium sp.]|nr:hypothetical protein [Candidatus Neoflavobacterium equi]